jgi:hypothetical protein
MAEKLEQLDWGGVDGKERWNNQRWKSVFVSKKCLLKDTRKVNLD